MRKTMSNPYFCFVRTNNEGATKELLAGLVDSGVLSLREIDPCCRSEVEELLICQHTQRRLFKDSGRKLPPSGKRWLDVFVDNTRVRAVDVNDNTTQIFLKKEGWKISGIYRHPNGLLYWAYSYSEDQQKSTPLAI